MLQFWRFTSCLALIFAPSFSQSLDSRSIARTSEAGTVNLVEFDVRGVIYGQCSYNNDNGQQVTVSCFFIKLKAINFTIQIYLDFLFLKVNFEDYGYLMNARSSIPTYQDPVTEARKCRAVATTPARPLLGILVSTALN